MNFLKPVGLLSLFNGIAIVVASSNSQCSSISSGYLGLTSTIAAELDFDALGIIPTPKINIHDCTLQSCELSVAASNTKILTAVSFSVI